jgi:hypothetical protein
VGSIDPAPPVTLASVFYPTNYPTSSHRKIGLVTTEKEALLSAANRFKSHEQYDNDHASLKELSKKEVAKLQGEDPQKPENWMMRRSSATWLACNGRVDIILEPTGTQSTEAYPNDASDARTLWHLAHPTLQKVESAANQTTATASLQVAR